MKLQTSIPPRRNGTVTVTGQDSQTYVFAADKNGELSCDVKDEATIAALLTTENFWPADPKDFEAAEKLVTPPEEDEDEDEPQTGLPIEAQTPPVRKVNKAGK